MTEADVAVECLGLKVPPSPYLPKQRLERIRTARYEGQEIAGALHVTRPGDRVLELGAGLGIVGGVVALNRRPSRMVSFEANPELIPHIRRLHALNRLEDIITLRNALLLGGPDRPATVPFHLAGSYLGSSLDGRGRQVEIATAGLAEVMADLAPDVLIADIEGGELDLLRHIDLTGIRAVVMEFHPKSYGVAGMRECKRILTQAGLQKLEGHSTRTVWACARA